MHHTCRLAALVLQAPQGSRQVMVARSSRGTLRAERLPESVPEGVQAHVLTRPLARKGQEGQREASGAPQGVGHTPVNGVGI